MARAGKDLSIQGADAGSTQRDADAAQRDAAWGDLRLDSRRSPLLAYGLAVLAAVLFTLLRLPLQPLIGGSNSFTLYYPGIILVGWFAGFGPAIFNTFLSAAAAEVFFIAPFYGASAPPRDIVFNLALFLVVGVALGGLSSGWRRAERQRRESAERQLLQEQALRRTEEGARESEERNEQDLRRLLFEQRRDRDELQIMARIGRILAAELDLQRLGQALTDEAAAALGATFGALYTAADGQRTRKGSETGREDFVLVAASGVPREALTAPLLPSALPLDPPADPENLVRSDDVGADARFAVSGREAALGPLSLAVRSYLAAPLVARSGHVWGGLVFGHAEPRRFGEREERILRGVALQAAVALDNAYLFREAREARDAAEAANRSKDEFLATVSHELRTPLNAMMGWAQLMQMTRGDKEKQGTGLETIVRNAKLQAQLIDDLLDMSRIVSGKMRLDVRSVDLVKVIDGAIDAVRPAAEAKGMRLLRVLDPLVGPVAGDPDRLQQVVWNLLSNAVKFTPKGGKVEIRLERVNSHLEILVADTGSGISPDFLPHVFERFRQSDTSTTRTRGGLGLGLAIVRHLVELHGGTVHVKSPGEGQGSTFIVRLPLSIAHVGGDRVHPRAKDDDPAAAEGAPDLTGTRVLVVDDEADSRDTLRQILEHCHAEVRTVGSAREALEALPIFRPHVILSDIGMPDEDGYSLIRRVRQLPPEQGGQTPAAALTAFARTEDRRRALLAGFEMHLSKPVELQELCAVVATLVRRTSTGN
jgi:signal transduction histidine kinase/CheY-like chemotaxis protein